MQKICDQQIKIEPFEEGSIKLKCRRRDLNPQGLLHTPLKRARIPIPPLRHVLLYLIVTHSGGIDSNLKKILPLRFINCRVGKA